MTPQELSNETGLPLKQINRLLKRMELPLTIEGIAQRIGKRPLTTMKLVDHLHEIADEEETIHSLQGTLTQDMKTIFGIMRSNKEEFLTAVEQSRMKPEPEPVVIEEPEPTLKKEKVCRQCGKPNPIKGKHFCLECRPPVVRKCRDCGTTDLESNKLLCDACHVKKPYNQGVRKRQPLDSSKTASNSKLPQYVGDFSVKSAENTTISSGISKAVSGHRAELKSRVLSALAWITAKVEKW